MLEVAAIDVYYGTSHILQGVSLAVRAGEVIVLLGRNGAGKTTTFRAVMGLTPARRGDIRFENKAITHLPPHAIVRAGLGLAPSGRRLFGNLTVAENLALAELPGGPWTRGRVLALFPKLAEIAPRRAAFLSGGEQQMLKIARALLAQPRLLLLDEPTEGLAPVVVRELGGWLRGMREEGLSILMAEQNARFALALADRGYVMEKGRILREGTTSELLTASELATHLALGPRQRPAENA
ncbi:MAG: ABC transporter ATP-binding protein [Rhodospirillales bacterium]|jgi:branched-chain amino acid transport system ATP-binding protein|uniref:ABC transporter ATP-binding protein n=1 Tax=Acidiphilium sp. TaxID=527 RepID=UPI00230C1B93|nr:ABC transporter ATP-binding protein [Acidiphilium sp.]MDA8051746.1 ABC transporter ATP-binding protein [Rhodospirillales bacterium]